MCSIGARSSANGLEIAVHDVGVDVAQRWMKEGFRKCADDCKFEALPEADGAVVGADDEIILHGAKSAAASPAQRMLAHRARHAAAGRIHSSHVAAIGDVSTTALLIRLQKIGADNFAVLFRNEYFMRLTPPILDRGRLVHVAWKRVRFTRSNDGRDDVPDGVPVGVSCGPDQHPVFCHGCS